MFANGAVGGGDSVLLRGGGSGNVDENSNATSLGAAAGKTPKQQHHKTPKRSQSTANNNNNTKRRAFGDISNRKQQQQQHQHTQQKLHQFPLTQQYKQHPPTVVQDTTTTTTTGRKLTTTNNNNNIKTVSFAPSPTVNSTLVPTLQQQERHRHHRTLALEEEESVEASAGRVWRDQVFVDDEDDYDDSFLINEQKAWQAEVDALVQDEQTRPVRIRQEQLALADKLLEQKMEALWKQDDQDLLKADLDQFGGCFDSVPSFDDDCLSLDSETFGLPAAADDDEPFPDDISF